MRSRTAGDPRIEWLGAISEADKIRHLRGAAVFCAPSLHGESFGIVLLEAMAASTPVVASDIPGYANVARYGSDALLPAPGDAEALAAALQQAIERGPEVQAMVDSGLERADEFSMRRLADRYLTMYEKAIGADPAAVLA